MMTALPSLNQIIYKPLRQYAENFKEFREEPPMRRACETAALYEPL